MDCIAATGASVGMWCDGKGVGGERYRVGGAVKVEGRVGQLCGDRWEGSR